MKNKKNTSTSTTTRFIYLICIGFSVTLQSFFLFSLQYRAKGWRSIRKPLEVNNGFVPVILILIRNFFILVEINWFVWSDLSNFFNMCLI